MSAVELAQENIWELDLRQHFLEILSRPKNNIKAVATFCDFPHCWINKEYLNLDLNLKC